MQLYKNNAHALLSHILSILDSDWLQYARSVRGVHEYLINDQDKQQAQGSSQNLHSLACILQVGCNKQHVLNYFFCDENSSFRKVLI